MRIIVIYKLARAALALGAAAVLAGFVATGHDAALRSWADLLRLHLSSHFGDVVARVAVAALTPRHLWFAVAALTFDGSLVLVEGWALWRGRAWGTWLVVASTAALLPFEVVGLWRSLRLGRAMLLAANLVVAVYLAWRALRERPVQPPQPS